MNLTSSPLCWQTKAWRVIGRAVLYKDEWWEWRGSYCIYGRPLLGSSYLWRVNIYSLDERDNKILYIPLLTFDNNERNKGSLWEWKAQTSLVPGSAACVSWRRDVCKRQWMHPLLLLDTVHSSFRQSGLIIKAKDCCTIVRYQETCCSSVH